MDNAVPMSGSESPASGIEIISTGKTAFTLERRESSASSDDLAEIEMPFHKVSKFLRWEYCKARSVASLWKL
jgi:hypothetical protein